jgi:aryl-alcohol dehydrogenase-like predicted oxidoreductase
MEAHMVARQYNLIGPVVEQPQYNLLHRQKFEVEYAQLYKTVGLGTTIWSPLASGLLTGKYNNGVPADSRLKRDELGWLSERLLQESNLKKVAQLGDLAKEIGTTLPLLSIAWCLKNPNVSTVILGATKEQQLIENLKGLETELLLTDEIMNRIEAIVDNAPEHPQY